MRSIFGECTGNVRSTPTPNESLRTVKARCGPPPFSFRTTPSKTCVRRRVPSTTWKWTRTRSPTRKSGTGRIWLRSRVSISSVIGEKKAASGGGVAGDSIGALMLAEAARHRGRMPAV